jgi:hypothetical protein
MPLVRLYPEISNECEPFSVFVVYLETVFLDSDPISSGNKDSDRIKGSGDGILPEKSKRAMEGKLGGGAAVAAPAGGRICWWKAERRWQRRRGARFVGGRRGGDDPQFLPIRHHFTVRGLGRIFKVTAHGAHQARVGGLCRDLQGCFFEKIQQIVSVLFF